VICQLGSIQTATVAMGWPVDPGALDRALELADRAYALDPSLPNVYIVRAGVYLNRGESRKAEAVELWESARAANPDLVTYRIPLIEHYESIGQHDEAAGIVGEVLAVNPHMTASVAATSGFAARAPDEVPALTALLRRAGLP